MRKGLALLTALLALVLGPFLLARSWPGTGQSSPATDPQVIAGPIPEKITSTSAVVWWQTTAPEESILVYGTSPTDQPYRVQRPWTTSTHEVSMKNLQPGTTYYLAILQPDGVKSAIGQFTTQPTGYSHDNNVRITNGPLFEQITPDSATVAWSANLPYAFVVHYGTEPQNLSKTANAPWTPTTHRVVLRGLESDTHYYFSIEANQQLSTSTPVTPESRKPTPAPPPAQIYAFSTLPRGQQALNIGPRHSY
jgi:phosphodiesterase/alkaline phosphatase D-like protein